MVCREKRAAWKDGDMVIWLAVAHRQFSWRAATSLHGK